MPRKIYIDLYCYNKDQCKLSHYIWISICLFNHRTITNIDKFIWKKNHTHTHTYTHTHIHTYIHIYIYKLICKFLCLNAYLKLFLNFMAFFLLLYLQKYLHTCIFTYWIRVYGIGEPCSIPVCCCLHFLSLNGMNTCFTVSYE